MRSIYSEFIWSQTTTIVFFNSYKSILLCLVVVVHQCGPIAFQWCLYQPGSINRFRYNAMWPSLKTMMTTKMVLCSTNDTMIASHTCMCFVMLCGICNGLTTGHPRPWWTYHAASDCFYTEFHFSRLYEIWEKSCQWNILFFR